MAKYDEVAKYLMDRFPDEFAALAIGSPEVTVEAKLPTEQPTVKMHHTDMTYRVRLSTGEAILHIEAQTDESRDKPMALRMLAYSAFLGLQHELPVYSTVLYLRPGAGVRDSGYYAYGDDVQGGLWYKYRVIRLSELEGSSFLESASVGLLPFTSLTRRPADMSVEVWVERCVNRASAAGVDDETRSTLVFALALFGSLKYGPEIFQALISEEMMRESPFYDVVIQRGVERGMERGVREASVRNILAVLTTRFPQRDLQPIEQALEAILDTDSLTRLVQTAVLTPTVEAFQQALDR